MQTKTLTAAAAVLALAVMASTVAEVGATPVAGQQPPRGAPPPQPNQPPQPPQPGQPPREEPPRAERGGQSINVTVDVRITDQTGQQKPVIKTVKLVVGDGGFGRVRSTAEVAMMPGGPGPFNREIPLNVDALPRILPEGKINLQVSLQYDLPGGGRPSENVAAQVAVTKIQESLTLVLESGKPVVIAESADPLTDRKVSVEVRATVMK